MTAPGSTADTATATHAHAATHNHHQRFEQRLRNQKLPIAINKRERHGQRNEPREETEQGGA